MEIIFGTKGGLEWSYNCDLVPTVGAEVWLNVDSSVNPDGWVEAKIKRVILMVENNHYDCTIEINDEYKSLFKEELL